MATQLTAVSLAPTVDGVQQTAKTLLVDVDADLGAAESGGYDNSAKTFLLTGLTKGQAIGLDWGTAAEATNAFSGVFSLELRPC